MTDEPVGVLLTQAMVGPILVVYAVLGNGDDPIGRRLFVDQNKQKLLIGALAVVALGAGSYYFFWRDTAPPVQQATTVQEFKPRERNVRKTDNAPVKKREERAPVRAAPDEMERRTRDVADNRPGPNRRTRGTGEKIEAKKKITPAS